MWCTRFQCDSRSLAKGDVAITVLRRRGGSGPKGGMPPHVNVSAAPALTVHRAHECEAGTWYTVPSQCRPDERRRRLGLLRRECHTMAGDDTTWRKVLISPSVYRPPWRRKLTLRTLSGYGSSGSVALVTRARGVPVVRRVGFEASLPNFSHWFYGTEHMVRAKCYDVILNMTAFNTSYHTQPSASMASRQCCLARKQRRSRDRTWYTGSPWKP